VATACARPTDSTDTGAVPGPYPPDALVLRVAYVGGFTAPTELVARLPVLSVYGDGRVVTPGPQPAVYPGPVLRGAQVQHISPAGTKKLVALAVAAGVGEPADFGQPPIADAASASFAVLTASGRKATEVYALSETDESPVGLTLAQRSARAKLRQLYLALTDLPKTLGADALDQAVPYRPATVAAIATAYQASGGPFDNAPELTWPGPALPGDRVDPLGVGCVAVSGDALPPVLDAAAPAGGATRWRSGDRHWLVTLRPLLPDETTCTDLPAK
jgi:hypothetical protein